MIKHIPCTGVTVITPTFQRDKQLAAVIQQVKSQKTTVPVTHLVVSDGTNPVVQRLCEHFNVRCITIDKEQDQGTGRGHLPRDTGITAANTEYVCLWDDDNLYFDTAIQTLYETAKSFDIGVCGVEHFFKRVEPRFEVIPRKWNGQFVLRNIDTMNVMIRADLARCETWSQFKVYEGDFLWLDALQRKYKPTINYSPVVIGIHL